MRTVAFNREPVLMPSTSTTVPKLFQTKGSIFAPLGRNHLEHVSNPAFDCDFSQIRFSLRVRPSAGNKAVLKFVQTQHECALWVLIAASIIVPRLVRSSCPASFGIQVGSWLELRDWNL